MIEYSFKDKNPKLFLDNRDLSHFALRLKRRMREEEEGNELASEIKSFSRALERVKFDVDLNNSNLIDSFKNFVKKAYPKNAFYAGYQVRGFETILDLLRQSKDRSVVVNAPTASGKSIVFLAPAIFNALNKGGNAVVIYPRLSLMQDQLSDILEVAVNIKNNDFSIGIQRTGFGSTDYITIKYGTDGPDSFFERKSKGTLPGIAMQQLKCPKCEGTIWAPTVGNAVGKFSCTNLKCEFKLIDIYVSKNSIINGKPKLLVTTIDSFNSLLFKRGFKEYLDTCDLVAFDEAHAYESLNGAHASNFIQRLTKLNSKLKIILASATIPNPVEFTSKLTGLQTNQIREVSPIGTAEIDQSASEIYRLITTDETKHAGTASLYLQLLMLLTRAVNININPNREKILSFLDSRDLVNRFYFDFHDADAVRKLPDFRIQKKKYLTTDFYKCPLNGEAYCDLKTCSNPSQPYFNGECWFGLTKAYFGSKMTPKTTPVKTAKVMSGFSDSIKNVDVIFSTSYMELGVDDKSITTVVQYRAPPSVYSFIQRKGRAGRDRNKTIANIWLVGGHETTDRFYYNNLDLMLEQSYHIPLNPENTYAVWVSRSLQFVSEKMEKEIETWISKGEKEDDYQLELTSVFQTIMQYFAPHNLKKRLHEIGIEQNKIITGTRRDNYRKSLKQEIMNNEKDLKILTSDNEDIFDSIAQKCHITSDPSNCLNNIEILEESLRNKDLGRYKEKHANLLVLFQAAMYDQTFAREAQRVMELLLKVPNLMELKNAIQRNKEIIYENKTFDEYANAFKYWDPYSAAIHLLRAVFYWTIAHPEEWDKMSYEGRVPYLMPTNFFSVGDTISLKIGYEPQRETNFHDLIFRYMPHRLTYYSADKQSEKSRLTLRYLVKSSRYVKEESKTYMAVTTNRVTGNERKAEFRNSTFDYIEPSAVNLEEIYVSSDTNEVKYCKECSNIFSDETSLCPYDRIKLEKGNVFSRAVFEYTLGAKSQRIARKVYGLIIQYYNLVQILQGEDLTITSPDHKKKKVNLTFEPPFGKELIEIPLQDQAL